MALTDYMEDAILNHFFLGVDQPAAGTLYVGLLTTSPDDTGDGDEVAGGSYSRQEIAFTLSPGGAGQVQNDADITFPSMPACTVVAAALYDAGAGGNMLAYGDLPAPVTYASGDNATASTGSFTFVLG